MKQIEMPINELVAQFLKRVADFDAEAAAELFADRIEWYVGGNNALPWTGSRSQRSDVAAYFRAMWPHFEKGKSSSTLRQVIYAEDEAVILATFVHTAASTGRRFETPVAVHLRAREGRIVKFQLYEDTWAVSQAFFD